MIGERFRKDLEESTAVARYGAAILVAALFGLAAASAWFLAPLADRPTMVRWGIALTASAVAAATGLAMLGAARRRAHAANRSEITDLHDAVESMGDGLLLWDCERRLVMWNERLFDLMPHLRGLLERGMDLTRLLRLAIGVTRAQWSDAQRQEWVSARRAQLDGADGVHVLALADERRIEVTQRRTAASGVVLLYRDVTERERTLLTIATSEARFRDAISSMGEGIAIWDREGRLQLWNQRYLEILPNVAPHARVGITLADLNTRAARTAYPHWSDAQIAALVERRLAARREPGVPFELRFDDGRVVEIVDHLTAEGGHVSIFRDVTDSHRAAAELAASEARFRDGLSSMADGFMMWDRHGRLVAWNERVGELLPYLKPFLVHGLDRQEMVRNAVDCAHPDWPEDTRRAWADERLASIADPTRKPPDVKLDDGRTIEMIDRPTSEGGAVTLYRDVTERERHAAMLERALQVERDANQQQRRFIAVASHEFRTPLAIIDGATQRLLARFGSVDDEIVQRLQRIRAAVARMTGLTEVTLSSARLESGQLEIKPALFDLGEMLRELRERQIAVTPEFCIEIFGADAPFEIEADQQLLDQALGNLLTNAVKYSGESRHVAMDVAALGGTVEISVRDFGVGIPAAELPQLFTRFFRASTSRKVSGTGIGLHFAREILALHHGSISVASEVGVGSTFTMRVPCRFAGRRCEATDRGARAVLS